MYKWIIIPLYIYTYVYTYIYIHIYVLPSCISHIKPVLYILYKDHLASHSEAEPGEDLSAEETGPSLHA